MELREDKSEIYHGQDRYADGQHDHCGERIQVAARHQPQSLFPAVMHVYVYRKNDQDEDGDHPRPHSGHEELPAVCEVGLFAVGKERRCDSVDRRLGIIEGVDLPYAVVEHVLGDMDGVIEGHLSVHMRRGVVFCVFVPPPVRYPEAYRLHGCGQQYEEQAEPAHERAYLMSRFGFVDLFHESVFAAGG